MNKKIKKNKNLNIESSNINKIIDNDHEFDNNELRANKQKKLTFPENANNKELVDFSQNTLKKEMSSNSINKLDSKIDITNNNINKNIVNKYKNITILDDVASKNSKNNMISGKSKNKKGISILDTPKSFVNKEIGRAHV